MDTRETYVRVIADLTRTRYGMERSVVKLLRRYCDEFNVDHSTLSIVVNGPQQPHLASHFDGATVMVLTGADVRQLIMGLVRGVTEDGLIRLLSYGRDVLELEREDKRIKSLSFGRYRAASKPANQSQRDSAADAPRENVVSEPIAPIAVAVAQQVTESEVKKPVYRSDVFQDILIKRLLGPFPDHRPLVYQAVEKIVKDGTRVRVSELFQRAIAEAKIAADARNKAAGREPRVDDRLWAGITKFSEQLFLDAKALIGPEGTALVRDWQSRALPVHDLAPGWVAMCDALLILGLVDAGENITSTDATNLARALYHSSTEQSESRVNDAVLYLLKEQIVEDTREGLRRVRASNEARMTPRLVASSIV